MDSLGSLAQEVDQLAINVINFATPVRDVHSRRSSVVGRRPKHLHLRLRESLQLLKLDFESPRWALGADSRRPTTDDLFDPFCHSLNFFAGALLDGLDYRAADDRGVGELADSGEVLWRGDAEAYGDGEICEFAEPFHQLVRVFSEI